MYLFQFPGKLKSEKCSETWLIHIFHCTGRNMSERQLSLLVYITSILKSHSAFLWYYRITNEAIWTNFSEAIQKEFPLVWLFLWQIAVFYHRYFFCSEKQKIIVVREGFFIYKNSVLHHHLFLCSEIYFRNAWKNKEEKIYIVRKGQSNLKSWKFWKLMRQ